MPYRCNVERLLQLATTERERAVGLVFAADPLVLSGERNSAVRLLALAFCYPEVADGWIGHLPEIVALQQELRERLPPDEFEQAWTQGQTLDLRATVSGLLDSDD